MQNKRAMVVAVGLSVIAAALLLHRNTVPAQAAKKAISASANNLPKAPAGLADNLSVTGQDYSIFAPDPKLPGRFLFKIWARNMSAQTGSGTSTGTLNAVTAYLFQHGRAAARLLAPSARADTVSQSVTATGRVRVFSLTQPGTTLEADTVVWRAKANTIDASGNVVYRNGKNGITLRGPHFVANTALQTLTSAGPGRATFH